MVRLILQKIMVRMCLICISSMSQKLIVSNIDMKPENEKWMK